MKKENLVKPFLKAIEITPKKELKKLIEEFPDLFGKAKSKKQVKEFITNLSKKELIEQAVHLFFLQLQYQIQAKSEFDEFFEEREEKERLYGEKISDIKEFKGFNKVLEGNGISNVEQLFFLREKISTFKGIGRIRLKTINQYLIKTGLIEEPIRESIDTEE